MNLNRIVYYIHKFCSNIGTKIIFPFNSDSGFGAAWGNFFGCVLLWPITIPLSLPFTIPWLMLDGKIKYKSVYLFTNLDKNTISLYSETDILGSSNLVEKWNEVFNCPVNWYILPAYKASTNKPFEILSIDEFIIKYSMQDFESKILNV
jgi:hypothetical protein